jgi:hypothetical protein
MYHITIRASTVENNNFLETEKTFTVTVTKNPDDDGGFHITTAANISISRGNMKSPIVIRILGYGYSEGFFSLKKVVIFHCGGFDCNMIHITLTFWA